MKFIFIYLFLSSISYVLLNNNFIELGFYSKKNDTEVSLSEGQKKTIYLIISIFWIYFLPRFLIQKYKKERTS